MSLFIVLYVLPLSMEDMNFELFQNGSFFVSSFFEYLPIENLRIMNSQVKPISFYTRRLFMERFTILKNDFLSHDCTAYFHLYYVGYGQLGNPDFIFHHTSTKMPSMLFSDYWTTACLPWRHKMVGVLY